METLLFAAVHDPRTFDAVAFRRMIRRLRGSGVTVIPSTEMTLEEIAPIAADQGLQQALILEAGGAIARWRNGAWQVEPCGVDADALVDVVTRIEDHTGARLQVCSPLEESEHRHSVPFAIESGRLDAIRRAAARLGFAVRRGHRFFHLRPLGDAGEAFTRLRDELACDLAIAVGSAPIDTEILSRAEVPVIVPGADGVVDPELRTHVPAARVATGGWIAAADEVLRRNAGAPRKRMRRVAS